MLQVVLIGPYEHHSNILPWKESGAKVHTISQTKTGQIDLVDLEEKVLVSKFHLFKLYIANDLSSTTFHLMVKRFNS